MKVSCILKGIFLRLRRFVIIDVNSFRRDIGSCASEFHPALSELSAVVALCYFNKCIEKAAAIMIIVYFPPVSLSVISMNIEKIPDLWVYSRK